MSAKKRNTAITAVLLTTLLAIMLHFDHLRRFSNQTDGYKMTFPLGWKPLAQDDPALLGNNPSAFYGDAGGRSTAVFVHPYESSAESAANGILDQARSRSEEVAVSERITYKHHDIECERLVFTAGDFGHHYTFARVGNKFLVISSNCSVGEFQFYRSKFDAIADSLRNIKH